MNKKQKVIPKAEIYYEDERILKYFKWENVIFLCFLLIFLVGLFIVVYTHNIFLSLALMGFGSGGIWAINIMDLFFQK